MKKLIWTWGALAALALFAAPTASEAQQAKDWLVCGGNSTSFDTCASVFADGRHGRRVDDQSAVTMKVWNLSGMNDSYEGTVFTKVGFFHQNYRRGGGIAANAIGGSLEMSGPTEGSATPWQLGNPNNAGGVVLDLAAHNGNGVDNGIAGGCDLDLLPAGGNDVWLNPCGTTASRNDAERERRTRDHHRRSTSTGDVGSSPPASCSSSARAVEGDDDSLQCITGGGKLNCEPVRVPEPTTWLLFAMGLGGLGLVHLRRRHESGLNPMA
ncbi:MAG: PEP-CTERM sorting domain-containing protein [Gemmatimonadota bacterium]|nr:PEP-CTERM sorting domain-containing protein [Gemmatimonadota bacterium]